MSKLNNMYVFRTYDDMVGYSKRLTQIDDSTVINIKHHNITEPNHLEKYFYERKIVEQIMYRKFVNKGGRPETEQPYYFSLHFPIDICMYNNPRIMCNKVSNFDKNLISFTIGDSMEAIYVAKGKYARKIYTYDELAYIFDELGKEYLIPSDTKFIEMQFWKNSIDEIGLLLETQKAISIVKSAKKDIEYYFYIIDLCYIKQNKYHDTGHAKRVLLLTIVLFHALNLDPENYELLCAAAALHDMARSKDGNDFMHGILAAKRLAKMRDLFRGPIENEILEDLLIYHCLEDDIFLKRIEKYKSCDRDTIIKLMYVLKDAGAIDRIRMKDLNIKYLRLEESKLLIDFGLLINQVEEEILNKLIE